MAQIIYLCSEQKTTGAFAFKHESVLGNAPANKLFDLVKIEKVCDGAPRKFEDYKVTIEKNNLPTGVTIEEMI